MVYRLKPGFTLRHKHKHNHKRKHNERSHLLHKQKESDIRKRTEFQDEAVGVWDEALFKNGGGRNCCSADARYFFTHSFLITAAFLRVVNVQLPVLTQKVFFYL